MLLTSTSDKIQVVTSSANPIAVHASYVDLSGATVTPLRANAAIAAATTTDVVASPGASTTRKIKFFSVFNDHASAAQAISVQHTDGVTPIVLWSGTVPAQSGVIFDEVCGWKVLGAETPGDVQEFDAPGGTWVKPTSFTPTMVLIQLWAGGGGGGAGASQTGAAGAKGGSGGGGGGSISMLFMADLLPDSLVMQIGSGGAGGVPGVAGASGLAGGAGEGSFVRTQTVVTSAAVGGGILLYVTGGTSGSGGQSILAGNAGGNGGSGFGLAVSSAFASFVGLSGSGNQTIGPGWEGGAAGGGSLSGATPTGYAGGTSRWGGGGGGSGGSRTATPSVVVAADGGNTGNVGSTAFGGGGVAGTSGPTPTAGANGADGNGISGGKGGGGGGATVDAGVSAGAGGNGGKIGGGGGGGGCGASPGLGGNGGNGGNGYGKVMTW